MTRLDDFDWTDLTATEPLTPAVKIWCAIAAVGLTAYLAGLLWFAVKVAIAIGRTRGTP